MLIRFTDKLGFHQRIWQRDKQRGTGFHLGMGAFGETGLFVGGIYQSESGFKRTILAFARNCVIYEDGFDSILKQCKRETFKKNHSKFAPESARIFPYVGVVRERVVNRYKERIDVHLFRDGVVRVRHPRVNPDNLESFVDLRTIGRGPAFCVIIGEPPNYPVIKRLHWFHPLERGAQVIEMRDDDADFIGEVVSRLQVRGKRPDAYGLGT